MSSSPRLDPPATSDDADHPSRTALVLGGGGSAGNAWLIGVVAGLVDGGLDVTQADLVVGTSAGSTAAAQLAGATPAALLADILAAAPPPRASTAGGGAARPGPAIDHRERTGRIIASAQDLGDMRRRLGAAALELEASSDATWSVGWRATVAARLPSPLWPDRRMLITAVDARTGDPVVLDRHSGVDLVDAVAASCSSGLPYAIGTSRYLDGGYRTNADNADLAAGYERVLVLSPLGGRSRTPQAWGTHLATQVAELRAGGSQVETVFPDGAALTAFGRNLMDPSTRPPAARAGYDQGRGLAGTLTGLWTPA